MPGCASTASTASRSPCTTLKTPAGRPASASSSASRTEADGSRSEGFRRNVFPQASAIGNIHIGTMAGKLNGVIPAATPSGWRMEKLSTPCETFSLKLPFSSSGRPQANSTTSRPRAISPRASDSTLPCSRVRQAASASALRATRSRNVNSTCARRPSEVSRQPGNARVAASTARSTVAASARATCACARSGRRVPDVAPARAALGRRAVDPVENACRHGFASRRPT